MAVYIGGMRARTLGALITSLTLATACADGTNTQPNDTDGGYANDTGDSGDTDKPEDTGNMPDSLTVSSLELNVAYPASAKGDVSVTNYSGDVSCSFEWTRTSVPGISYEGPGDCTLVVDTAGLDVDTLPDLLEGTVHVDAGDDVTGSANVYVDVGYEDTPEEHAPVITTTSLDNGTTTKEYSMMITATDADGDDLTFSLVSGPSWLNINSSGELYSVDAPTTRGDYIVEVQVEDETGRTDTQLATVDINIYDAGGATSADNIDTSCGVEVLVTSMEDDSFSELVSVGSDSIAHIEIDEQLGEYDIFIESTNTGSDCYGGMYQESWFNVVEGSNTAWAHLISGTNDSEVASVVDGALNLSDKGWASEDVNTMTELMQYMTDLSSSTPDMYGLDADIQDSTRDMYVDTSGGYSTDDVDFDDCFTNGAAYWDGHMAPGISMVSSGGDIYWDAGSNWSAGVEYDEHDGVWWVTENEIEYSTETTSQEDCVSSAAHEIGHTIIDMHTDVDDFIMNSSPNEGQEPHDLELEVVRTFLHIGNLSPNSTTIYADPTGYFN
jgi:hypothetical protein